MVSHPDYTDEVAKRLQEDLFSDAYYYVCDGLHDIDGLVAYGIYKEDKRQALLKQPLCRTHGNFHQVHNQFNERRRDTYRENAHARLKEYGKGIIEKAKEELEKECLERIAGKFDRRWQNVKSVGFGLLTATIFTIFFENLPIIADNRSGASTPAFETQLQELESRLSGLIATSSVHDDVEPAASAEDALGTGDIITNECDQPFHPIFSSC